MATKQRRDYQTGSITLRPDGRWVGRFYNGYTATGNRRRVAVYGKTKSEVQRKLREKMREVATAEAGAAVSSRTTVKAWADQWLEMTERTMRPRPWASTRSAVRLWIVPTIGHKRLNELAPADVRAVANAQRAKGRSTSTASRTQSVLSGMLRDAQQEGHQIPEAVFRAPRPATAVNDRTNMSIPEALAALRVASDLPHGSRWAGAFLHGWRQGECLGLTWPCINLEVGLVSIEWELQQVPLIDREDPRRGYRIPEGLPHRHLTGPFHLLPPKTKKGFRTYQLVPAMVEALAHWKEVAPANEWGLVWPTAEGRPTPEKTDRAEWHAIQAKAGIAHPAGRPFHTHEIRHTTATELLTAGAKDHEVTTIMGHSSIRSSRTYQHPDQQASREVLQVLASRFGMDSAAAEATS